MNHESLAEHKRKITATLAWCANLEQEYINGKTKNPPHLLNVCVALSDGTPIWYTVEVYPASPKDLLICWDIKFNKQRSIPFHQIIDVEINSLSYNPVGEEEWKDRERWTNLQYNPDLEIRQSKGRF